MEAKRNRRSHKTIFVDALKKLSQDKVAVSNKALREFLGWSEEKYERIKSLAEDEGDIERKRGQGGSVALKKGKKRSVRIFVSYSHVDTAIKNELVKHLKPLERSGLITKWHDGLIQAGDEWEKKIFDELETADIILLLVSVDFINSKFCYERELEQALERNDNKEAEVIPVILRNCLWQKTLFARLQAVPTHGRPVMSFPSHDDAYVEIVGAIEQVALRIVEKEGV